MKFEKAQEKNIEFLTSEKFEKKYSLQSTHTSIPVLVQINKAGFITRDSQEGDIKEGFNEKAQWYYEIKERAYVTGFMKNKHACKFINRININTNKVAFKVYKTPTQEFPDSRIAVTISRKGAEKPLTGPFKASTAMNTSYPRISPHVFYGSLKYIDDVDIVQVVCFDPEYGRQASDLNGLYQNILEHL